MGQRMPSTPNYSSAPRWLKTCVSTLFAVVRRVVCAYDLGLELSALIGHRWEAFDAAPGWHEDGRAIELAGKPIAKATAHGVVPTAERERSPEPLMMTSSNADLHRLCEMAHASLVLDADAVDALATLERSAPSTHLLSRLDPSHLVRRAVSDIRPARR